MLGILLPSFLIVIALGISFMYINGNPKITAAFIGIRPAIIALIVYAGVKIGKTAILDKTTFIIAMISLLILLFLSIHPVIVIGCIFVGMILIKLKEKLGLKVENKVDGRESMLLWNLFSTFFLIGLVSFGGGYAMIPIIEIEVYNHDWLSPQEFSDIIALAGMSPGSIATNSAIFIGFKTAGILGAIVAALGITLPSLFIILIVASFFYKVSQNKIINSAFYGLRPIITGLIIYAAIRLAIYNQLFGAISWYTLSLILIFLLALFALVRLRMHPFFVIILSGLIGIAFYY